jgi:Tetratricopeptide repeat
VFVVDDLLGWLVGLVADAGRKKLVTLVLGTDQERALRSAVGAAVAATATQLAPSDKQADQLATAIGEVFRGAPKVALAGQGTLLEALQAGIAARVAVLDDPDATGTAQSAMELGVPGRVLAQTLAGYLVHEITVRGAQGGPLTPLADQLNHDMTHLQGQRLEEMLAQVVGLVTTLAQAGGGPQVPKKPVRLAPRPVRLAGREELLAGLDAKLTGGGDVGPRIAALCGLGGAGKTSVAVEYAHEHLGEVGVAWQFPAEDATILAAGFVELAAQLGAQDLAGTQDPVASVHAVLAASLEGWLLVFDNAPDRPAVTRFLPPAGRGRVLITSRNANWPPGQVLDVPVLGLEAAAGFLVARTSDQDEQAATELAGELGRLPLALEQAGAYVQATGGSLAGYLASFRRRRPDILARGETGEYGKTVATTWSLAFADVEQSAPQAAGLLRLLAFCAPEPVPLRRLLQPEPGLAEELAEEAAPVLVPLLADELAAGDAVAALRRYSLVTAAGDGLVLVHRLVQAVTTDQMPEDLRPAWRAAAAAVVEAAIPADVTLPESWRACALLLPHARAVLDLTSRGMWRIAQYLGYSGSYLAARNLFQQIADACSEDDAYGPEDSRTLAARSYLARWAGDAGDAAGARDQCAALLPILEGVLGAEHPETLTIRGNLSYYTGEAGDEAGARDQLGALLPILKRALGREHPATLAARSHLARFTGQAGDAAGARDQYAALLPITERVLGPEHPDALAIRAGLAHFTGQAGDAAGARDQYAALLPLHERVLGAEHPDTLDTRQGLAYWTGEAGDAAGARDQYAALLPLHERVLGAEHPDTLDTRIHLAVSSQKAGDTAGARHQFAALVPITERVLGPEHPRTLMTRHDLAYSTGEAGDPAGARDQLAALLPTYSRIQGPEHPLTLLARHDLARFTGEAGDPAGARDQYAALLPIRKRVLGPEHPRTLQTRSNLARFTGEAGDPAAARGQYGALLPICERILGTEHPDTLATRGNLAHWTGEAGG